MTLQPITETDFQHTLTKHPYYKNRWEYFQAAIRLTQNPLSVLELGPYKLPLFPAGDTMDIRIHCAPTYHHDARITPWPIPDKTYDLFIALQVWEHLKKSQAVAFAEVMRIADRAILSFPYKWNCPHNQTHHMIDKKKIERWTRSTPYTRNIIVGKRIIYYWEFNNQDED